MMDLGKLFYAFRSIFCECPECQGIFRLSDAQIYESGKGKMDWLSEIDGKISKIQDQISRAEDAFHEKQIIIREKQAKIAERQVNSKVNELIPGFKKISASVKDIKPIGYPIKFVSFDGKDNSTISKIRLVDFEPESLKQEKILLSLDKTIKKGNLDWLTLRVDESGKLNEEK